MPDVFDTLTLDAPADTQAGGDVFDSIELPKTEPAKPGLLENFVGGVWDVAKGTPAFVAKLPGYALKGVEAASGAISPADALGSALKEAIPQGQALAKGLQSEPGSREWFSAAIQAGLLAAPAIDLIKGVKGGGEIPPTQGKPPIAPPPVTDIFDKIAEPIAAAAPPITRDEGVASPVEAPPLPETQTAPATADDVYSIPTNQIASRPELMQFKRMDNAAAGTNEADQITAPYDPIKAGNLLLWEPSNPETYGLSNEEKYIVANGHHRNAAATGQGVEAQNAQILRESAGLSAEDARALAAEANIADGKGTVYDQAKFIRNESATHGPDAALERARQIGARGQKAATIALEAEPDLYTSFVNEQVTPDAAASIAGAAPGNAGLQRLGIDRALKGDAPNDVANFLQATQAQLGDVAPAATQVDLFASDDTAIQAAVATAKRAGAIQREIGDQISSVQGAAKRPEKAAALGVNVQDPASVLAKLDQLRALRERARSWATDPQIRDLAFNKDLEQPQEAVKALTGETGARPVSAIDLSDPNTPIAERGPTLALKLDDGTVVYDSSSRLHSQVLDKAGVEPTRVVDSGIYKPISKEFVSKTPDTVEIFPKSKPETIAGKATRLDWEKNPNSIGQRLFQDTGSKPAPDLALAPPESDAEMLARQQTEAQSNAALQTQAEKQAQLQTGWQQPITGTTGDLGQMGLGADVGGPEDLFGIVGRKPDSPPEIGETVISKKTGKSYVVSYVDPEGKIYGRAEGKGGAVALGKDVQRQIFGFGPGAAAVGEIPLRAESELAQLHNVITDALKDEPRTASATRRVEVATKAATKAPGNSAGNTVKAAVSALWDAYKNPVTRPIRELLSGTRAESDFIRALKDWQGADQWTSFYVHKWVQDLQRQIPDKFDREAITNYIQADGDAALLRARADASNAKFRPGYEAALNLTPAQKVVAENVRQYYDSMHRIGVRAGILNGAVENYITQMWKRPNKFTNALMADVQAGRLQKDFKYARKRIFDSFFEGEQAHYEPATKDFSALVAAYDLAFNKSLSARALINSLREAKAADGEPVTRFSGMTQPVPSTDVPVEAYLIRPKAMPTGAIASDGRAYRIIDHTALRRWKFVTQEGAELPAYYQADMLVHPDHFEHLNNVLKTSAWRQGALGMMTGPVFKLGALAKQTRLSLSIFHLDQTGLHGLFHRVNPANLEHIDFNAPKQWQLVRNGLQVSDYSAMELFAEGLRGGGLVSKIPVLGELQNRFNEFLFKDYIPRLKMTMALHAFDRNVGRYPDLAPDTIAEMTARQANAAFGELNYKLMGRSPTVQDSLRLAILAPDFLEARSKFVGQALKPYGQEQRTAILLGSAVLYVGSRALNQWLDNDPHWDKLFSVIYNGREYRLRTVMGDVYEAFTDPRRFLYNRFSPWLKLGATLISGRDYRGIKLTGFEQFKDFASWFVPIPVGQGNSDQNIAQRLAASAGVSNKPSETPIDRVYKAALQYKESLTDPKIQQEVKRAQQETYAQGDYAKLNRALIMNDKEQAVAEIVSLMKDKGKKPIDLTKYYSNLPQSPFTGSRMLDFKWQRSAAPPEQTEYRKAIAQRVIMSRLFYQLYPMAAAQYRSEK